MKFINFIFIFILLSAPTWALSRKDELARHQIVETTLKNGMHVCLKQSQLEPGEFHFQLFALGGYASLPVADQPSARLAAEITWESGLGRYSGDQLDCALDDHGVDMEVKLSLFDRQIEGVGDMGGLPFSLKVCRLLFTDPKFNDVGYKKAIFQTHKKIQEQLQGGFSAKELALKLNLRSWHQLRPLTTMDLTKIDIEKSATIFKKCFKSPSEFRLVLIGDFNPSKIIPLLEQTLGSLPNHTNEKWEKPEHPTFPPGITQKEFLGNSQHQKLYTRLTIPLAAQAMNPFMLDLFCTLLKQKLKQETKPNDQWLSEVKISYQNPLFPHFEPAWLVVKFLSPSTKATPHCQSLLTAMKSIKKTGITEKDIQAAYQELIKNSTTATENSSQLLQLANAYRAGWEILEIYQLPEIEKKEKEMLKIISDCYPSLEQYSLISFYQ